MNPTQPRRLFFLLLIFFALSGCASSEVSRNAASNVDMGVQNARNLTSGFGSSEIADSYQNTSQASKGAMLGGAAGGLAGSLMGGIGFVPGAATGAMLGGSYGSYIDSRTTLADKLENRGSNIIVLGDQVMIVLPSARIFSAMSSNIKPQAYPTLDLVSEYINSYTKMLVKVAAYTDAIGPQSVNLALSQQQANNVVKYLNATGVDARVLYAVGYGGTNLVVKNAEDWGVSDNYRIEITLEKLQV